MKKAAATLFEAAGLAEGAPRPLADRLRPASLDEVIGQDHLLGAQGMLARMVTARRLSSVIFWGPPGTGKTTVARLLAEFTDLHFEQLSAIHSGVSDLRKGQRVKTTITLVAPVEDPPRDVRDLLGRHPLTGCKVANLSPAVAQEVGVDDDTREGVVVLEVMGKTPAARLGVKRGDIVVAVNNEKVKSVAQLVTVLDLAGGGWRLSVERGGKVFNLAIQG